MFNLDCLIPLTETQLRKKFSQIMELANERLDKSVVYDDLIYIIIENIQLLKGDDVSENNLIKYWLPRLFPNRFRVIVTTNKKSEAFDYFQYLEQQGFCSIINIKSSKPQQEIILKRIQKYWYMNQFNKKIVHTWQGLNTEITQSYSFTKLWFDLFL